MARPLKKGVKPSRKKGPLPPESEQVGGTSDEDRLAESGEPDDMKELGESISGTQPEIGHKDTGIGRRIREDRGLPPSAP